MESIELQVRMLGEFSVMLNGEEITDSDNRSRKLWLLLAYMIYCRHRSISQEDLLDLLWGEEERSSNPLNALKTMFHRVRTMLNQLGVSAGHMLIIRRAGSYAWNTDIPFTLDIDLFEQLCKAGSANTDEDARLDLHRQALSLYGGDFLPKLSSEAWVVPISAYFHNLYVQTVLETLPLLESRNRLEEISALCRTAIGHDPYNEALYQHLMRALLELGDQGGVMTLYDELNELMMVNFGIMPSEDIRALYREAVRIVNDRAISLGTVQEQLREPDGPDGALVCDYDFFRVVYHAEARAVARSGDAVHIGLISVLSKTAQDLPKRSLDRAMENLQELIRSNLRKGDVASRCSVSQYILMLPQANYENSCMVCDRIVRTFFRQYPHSPVQLQFSVQPLQPNA